MVQQSLTRHYPEIGLMALVAIDPCTPENYSDVRELQKVAIRSHGWHFYSLREVEAKLREIDDPDFTCRLLKEKTLLAHINQYPIGTASWRPDSNHPQTAIITRVYVHPFFANAGITTALVREIECAAFHKGFRFISAHSDLNSRSCFTKLGYEGREFESTSPNQSAHYPLQIMARRITANEYCNMKPNQELQHS